MHVLVTGNLGYIGPVVVETLRAAGHQVTGWDTDFFYECDLFPLPKPDYQVFRDVRGIGPDDLDGIDGIVHLAALSNDPLGALDPKITESINHLATVRLARIAKSIGIPRFIFASSCSIYGFSESGWVAETDAVNPLTEYAESKAQSEIELVELMDDSFTPVMLRNATAYGLSARMRFDLVLNNLVGCAVTSGQLRIMSDGTPWRPMIHIRDIAKACLMALEAPKDSVAGQILNVGSEDQNHQVNSIASAASKAVADAQVLYTGEHGADSRSYRVAFKRIYEAIPGFACDWDIERGAAEIRDGMLHAKVRERDFISSRFTRLHRLQELLGAGDLDDQLYWRR